ICELPVLDSDYLASDVDDPTGNAQQPLSPLADLTGFENPLRIEQNALLTRIKDTLVGNPNDLLAQVARASLLEEIGQTDRALAVYRLIRHNEKWPGATWAQEPIAR